MAKGTRRAEMKNRMTPRRLSWYRWFLHRLLYVTKIVAGVAAVVGLMMWVWAQGYLLEATQWAHDKVAIAGAAAGLVVEDVIIEGRGHIDTKTLKTAINVTPGTPILGVDIDAIHARLMSISWVESAQVRRALPDRLMVDLTERLPVALWLDAPGGAAVIDRAGVVLTRIDVASFGTLLGVAGRGCETKASEIIALLQAQPDIAVRVKKAVRVSERRWDLVLDGGMMIRLPESDPGYGLARAARAQLQERVLDQDLKAVDLRQADRIILENKPVKNKEGEKRDLLLKGGNPV
jgi:cell division protein FtsQ